MRPHGSEESPPTKGRRARHVGATLSKNGPMCQFGQVHVHCNDPSALHTPLSTHTRPSYGLPFWHCVFKPAPTQSHELHEPHVSGGKGLIKAISAGIPCVVGARNCDAPAGHDDEAATKGRAGAGGDETGASPARDTAAKAMRSMRGRKQLDIFIAWNLLLASGVALAKAL